MIVFVWWMHMHCISSDPNVISRQADTHSHISWKRCIQDRRHIVHISNVCILVRVRLFAVRMCVCVWSGILIVIEHLSINHYHLYTVPNRKCLIHSIWLPRPYTQCILHMHYSMSRVDREVQARLNKKKSNKKTVETATFVIIDTAVATDAVDATIYLVKNPQISRF